MNKLIDFYQVLGITNKESSIKEIKDAYMKLVVKYHPDKQKPEDKEESTQYFELLQKAWDVLGNEEKRKQYDSLYSTVKNSHQNHHGLKSQYDEYTKNNKISCSEEQLKQKQLEFEETMKMLNTEQTAKVPVDETSCLDNLIKDIELQREQDDIEYQPRNILGENFDVKNNLEKFNAIFEFLNKKDESSVVQYEGMMAWNESSNNGYAFVDDNKNVVNEFDSSLNYEHVKKKDINNIVFTKDMSKKEYDDLILKRQQERQQEDEFYKNRTMKDYSTDRNKMFNKVEHNIYVNSDLIADANSNIPKEWLLE